MNDVIVFLPGILGSALEKDGKSVWDISAGAISRALFSLNGSIQNLALKSDDSTGDGVKATRLLHDAHIVPFLWKIDGYSGLSKFIQSELEVVLGENYFEFPYDWRLDNRISANRLASATMDWLENRRRRHADARLILIGHSMGGLVARYFVEKLEGWRYTKTLITLGTPHRGSVKALDFLANGLRKHIGPVKLIDLTRLIQTFPSVHQLLPIYPCLGMTEEDLQALETIIQDKIGGLDVARAQAGIEFHREIEQAVKINRKQSNYGCRLIPVVGTFQPTYQSALMTEDGIKPLRTYKGQQMLDGDGTVPRLSATPIELCNTQVETFVSCPHASLQNFEPVRVQIEAVLKDIDISEIKAVAGKAIALDMQDAYFADEIITARARCDGTTEALHATLINTETAAQTEYEFDPSPNSDEWQRLTIGALSRGTYRIRLQVGDIIEPIDDLFVVLDEKSET